MAVFVLIMGIILFWRSKPVRHLNNFYEDNLKKDNMLSWRGIMAMLVLLCHLTQRSESVQLAELFKPVGYMMVGGFFFLSSYGLQKKFMEDPSYCKGFLWHRTSAILVPYVIVNIFYWLGMQIIGYKVPFSEMLTHLFSTQPYVSFSWYVMVILLYYVAFGIGMYMSRTHPERMLLVTIGFCCFWYQICDYLAPGSWWFDTTPVLIFGALFAVFEKNLRDWIEKDYYFITAVALLAAIGIYHLVPNIFEEKLFYYLRPFFFVTIMILISMKIRVGNAFTEVLGKISFELYLIHGLFLSFFRCELIEIKNEMIYGPAVVLSAVLAAYLLNKLDRLSLKQIRSLSVR